MLTGFSSPGVYLTCLHSFLLVPLRCLLGKRSSFKESPSLVHTHVWGTSSLHVYIFVSLFQVSSVSPQGQKRAHLYFLSSRESYLFSYSLRSPPCARPEIPSVNQFLWSYLSLRIRLYGRININIRDCFQLSLFRDRRMDSVLTRMLLSTTNLLTQEHQNLFFSFCVTHLSMFKHPPIPLWKEMLLRDQRKQVPRQKDLIRRVQAIPQDIGFKLLRVTFCLTTRHGN